MRRSSFQVISVFCLSLAIFISLILPFSVTGQIAPKPSATITHSEPIKAQVIKSHRRHGRHKNKTTAAQPKAIGQPSDDDKKLREIKEQKDKLKSQH